MATTKKEQVIYVPGCPEMGTPEEILNSGAAIYREFCEKNPMDPRERVHPGMKARRIARYLEHLADVFDKGSSEKTKEGLRRASIAALNIQQHVLDKGQPHERLANVIDTFTREAPHLSDREITAQVLLSMMHSHPFVAYYIDPEKLDVAVQVWRVDGRKNRATRRAEGGNERRWEALAAVLEGTGAQVAPSTIKQAFFARRGTTKKSRM